jgi:sec-independent protein translocase protein TatC
MSDTQTTTDGPQEREAAVMPLMEHLRELRNRLIRAFIALIITTLVSLIFTRQVLIFLIAPMGATPPSLSATI